MRHEAPARRALQRAAMRMLRTALAVGAVAAIGATGACDESRIVEGVSDSVFVSTMADLKRAQTAIGLDSARRAALRDSILQGRGLTPAQLEHAARVLAENPARAQAIWQAIERRAADTAQVR